MSYIDQFEPWRESENVLDEMMILSLLANGDIQKFVHNYLDIELKIKAMAWSAKTYVRSKKRFDP